MCRIKACMVLCGVALLIAQMLAQPPELRVQWLWRPFGAPLTASADGSLLISAYQNHLSVWDLNARRPIRTAFRYDPSPTYTYDNVSYTALSADGSLLVVAAGAPDWSSLWYLRAFNPRSWERGWEVNINNDNSAAPAVSPDGRFVAVPVESYSQGYISQVWLLNGATGELVQTIPQPSNASIVALSYLRDGRLLSVVGKREANYNYRLWL